VANTVTNQNKPSGLTPVKYLNGADWTGQANIYYIDGTTNADAFNVGDLVSPLAGLDAASGLQTIGLTKAASSTICLGVAIAFGASPTLTTSLRGGPYIDPTNLTLINVPATKVKNYFALVVDDPKVVYEIQETGAGTTPATSLTFTATSKNASFVYAAPAAGVAVSGTTLDNGVSSGHVPQTATTVTNGFFLRILGLSQKYDPSIVNYNTFGLYAKWYVKLINQAYEGTVVGF
jgi:hypothetical protein